jgi:hypothetical protein
MEPAPLVELVPALALAIALAACAGLRAWLPLLLAGGMARLGYLQLGDSFAFLSSNKALLLFAVATLVEVVGDKFPTVDHALDVLGSVLRPAAGILLAASVIGQVTDPLTALALGVAVGGPSALVPDAAKSTARALSTGLTGGLANPVISLLEDAAVVAFFALALLLPLLAAGFVVAAAVFVARRLRPRAARHA